MKRAASAQAGSGVGGEGGPKSPGQSPVHAGGGSVDLVDDRDGRGTPAATIEETGVGGRRRGGTSGRTRYSRTTARPRR